MNAIAVLLSFALAPQSAEPTPLEQFIALPEEQQSVVVRAVERRVMLDPDDLI